ncbi:MAG: helix-turn-helix domain-containing protein [Ginsengibacter sp.]
MVVDFVTKEDLQDFKIQLLKDIKELLKPGNVSARKPWLKNAEVRSILNISSNTLQRLRITGKLRSTKVGGINFYRMEDIERMMNGGGEK